MRLLSEFLNTGQLTKDESAKSLSAPYLEKSKANMITMELLSKSVNFKDILALPQNYRADEWVIVAAYYSMYLAALSVLAKLGYRCKSHAAAIVALEEFLVKKDLLDKNYPYLLEKVRINKDEIEMLKEAKDKREIAQYSVTKKLTMALAEEMKIDARHFVDKMEEILDVLK